ncbi:MAG: hypothetical protein HN390_12175 [Anaerolineae bacterium]|jgi:hypothetical protein|nr:hypothetical protein [Anaerolineae bacterium]MBT4460089.1 hypothetical protein [Anaerolineae bacterium]MBT7191679.1 hypothetical protein [Anaerolineae bacterium]MBT7991766.1 hypothetical protein [Anaerolineae bacterium]
MDEKLLPLKRDEIKNSLDEARFISGFGFFLSWIGEIIQKFFVARNGHQRCLVPQFSV